MADSPSHPIPPLQVVTEDGVERPASYSEFPLALCFAHGNIHVSGLLSQFVPMYFFDAV